MPADRDNLLDHQAIAGPVQCTVNRTWRNLMRAPRDMSGPNATTVGQRCHELHGERKRSGMSRTYNKTRVRTGAALSGQPGNVLNAAVPREYMER